MPTQDEQSPSLSPELAELPPEMIEWLRDQDERVFRNRSERERSRRAPVDEYWEE